MFEFWHKDILSEFVNDAVHDTKTASCMQVQDGQRLRHWCDEASE